MYKRQIVNCSTPKEPYLLVYTYGVDKPLENRIVHFARENNLKIVSPCFWHLWADCVVECSALEFSGLVANANYVFTLSLIHILNQTFKDFEFIIINDGSVDHTKEIIREYNDPRIVLLENDKNRGIVLSLNKGLDAATGKYIARMDADDIASVSYTHLNRIRRWCSSLY